MPCSTATPFDNEGIFHEKMPSVYTRIRLPFCNFQFVIIEIM